MQFRQHCKILTIVYLDLAVEFYLNLEIYTFNEMLIRLDEYLSEHSCYIKAKKGDVLQKLLEILQENMPNSLDPDQTVGPGYKLQHKHYVGFSRAPITCNCKKYEFITNR